MSTAIAIDSARVETTREIDNDDIITYIRRRYFLPASFTATYSFSYRCLLVLQGTRIHREEGERPKWPEGACMHQIYILQLAMEELWNWYTPWKSFPG